MSNNHPTTYLGNSQLKDINVKIQFTEYRKQEFFKCAEDPIYFITKYIQVFTVDNGIQPFTLWDFQQKLIETVHDNRFIICKMPRQTGKSTVMIAYFLHYILFNKDKKIGILANKRETAIELLSRLQLAFELLPQWLQQGVKTWNKTSIELENGCRIEAHATSAASVRGKTYNIIFLDEFAHIESKLAERFWTSTYPVISSGKSTKVIIVSTPNGMNLFYDLWTKAELPHIHKDWNQFVTQEVHYSEVPGRDEEWARKTISVMGQEKFDQEFGVEFLGTGTTLIGGRFLKTMETENPLHSQNNLDVYDDPQFEVDEATGLKKSHVYVMCADTAYGKALDYSTFTIVDVTNSPYKVVAKYRSNTIPPTAFADVMVPIGRKYNNAYILIELDGPGNQVADDLQHIHEYENIFTVGSSGRSGQMLSTGFGPKAKTVQRGVKMTEPVRRTGCANLKTLIESKRLLIPDQDIKFELSSFSLRGNRYEAEEGKHDDLVMTLVCFSWLYQNKHFRDLMDAKVRQSLVLEYEPQFDHDLTPYGWVDDGRNGKKAELDDDMPGDLWISADSEIFGNYREEELNKQRYEQKTMDRLKTYFDWV